MQRRICDMPGCRLKVAAVEDRLARRITSDRNGLKFHPGFVEVADFGREGVRGIAVGDDDFDCDFFTGQRL